MFAHVQLFNDCLLSTPRTACVNFPNGFFSGSAHYFNGFSQHLQRVFQHFQRFLQHFQRVPNGDPTVIQRFANALGRSTEKH